MKEFFQLNKPYEFDPTDITAIIYVIAAVVGSVGMNPTIPFFIGSAISTTAAQALPIFLHPRRCRHFCPHLIPFPISAADAVIILCAATAADVNARCLTAERAIVRRINASLTAISVSLKNWLTSLNIT